MNLKHNFMVAAVALVAAGAGAGTADAGKTTYEAADLACVIDKWDEKEADKGHKLVDYASRCIIIPDDNTFPKAAETCAGKFEYKPDGSWKGTGTCTDTFKGGDTISLTWEEGSHLKEYIYTKTSGTGKYEGVKGGGTYMYDNITDTASAGRIKGSIVLP
jgi:hypothetical protein